MKFLNVCVVLELYDDSGRIIKFSIDVCGLLENYIVLDRFLI